MSEKNLFLVTGVVVKKRYMVDESESINFSHLIEASNDSEARVMAYCFYERKSSSYDVNYSVYDVDVSEVISFELTKEEKENYKYILE